MKKKFRIVKRQLKKTIDDAVTAAKDGGREICGFLVDNGYFLEIVHVRNKVKRGGGFAFYVNEVRALGRAAEMLGHDIVGTFHSHPLSTAEPGESDIISAVDDSLMIVIDVMEKKAKLWHVHDHAKCEIKMDLL